MTPATGTSTGDDAFAGSLGLVLVLDRELTEAERADLASGRVSMQRFAVRHGMEPEPEFSGGMGRATEVVDQPKVGTFVTTPLDFSGWPAKLAKPWQLVAVQSDGGKISVRVNGKPVQLDRDGDWWRIRQ